MAGRYDPKLGWACNDCGRMRVSKNKPGVCSECGDSDLRNFNVKEEMVRLAERNSNTVEIVKESEILSELGGVGCLLRYRVSDVYAPSEEPEERGLLVKSVRGGPCNERV